MTDLLILKPGDIVSDAAGDYGKVVKVGQPKVKLVQSVASAGANAQISEFEPGPATALVQWETLNGKPVFMQASWEDVGDLTFAKP